MKENDKMMTKNKKASKPKAAAKKTTAKASKKAAAIERARQFVKQGKRVRLGTVLNCPEGYHAIYMVPSEMGPRAAAFRAEFSAKGFEHCEGASVSGIQGAEVWVCPQEVHDLLVEWRTEATAAAKNKLLRQWKIDAETIEHVH